MLGDDVSERGGHRSEALYGVFRDIREQLIFESQGGGRRFGKQLFDERAACGSRSIGDFVYTVDELTFGIGAVDCGCHVQRRRQDLCGSARRRGALRRPLFDDAASGNFGAAADDELLPQRRTLALDLEPHDATPPTEKFTIEEERNMNKTRWQGQTPTTPLT